MMIGVDGMRMEVTLWEPRGEETLPRNHPQDHPSLITPLEILHQYPKFPGIFAENMSTLTEIPRNHPQHEA